jgi:glycosyltransferase involved in cell wall biosynthesis
MQFRYILITAARNEAEYIPRTIESVINQTVLPVRWVIVNDSSTDATEAIVSGFARENGFIRLINMQENHGRDFSSKVHALSAGIAACKDAEAEFLGILDADITLDPSYYEKVQKEFEANPKLGIAGGVLYDVCKDKLLKRDWRPYTVAGGIQVFRRMCFDDIGGLLPLRYGSEDSVAEISARMKGWQVRSFRAITGHHIKPTGRAQGSPFSYAFKHGIRDYAYGTLFFFELIKCMRRIKDRPFFIHAFVRILGFVWSIVRREHRLVSPDFIRFYRREQLSRFLSGIAKPFGRLHRL